MASRPRAVKLVHLARRALTPLSVTLTVVVLCHAGLRPFTVIAVGDPVATAHRGSRALDASRSASCAGIVLSTASVSGIVSAIEDLKLPQLVLDFFELLGHLGDKSLLGDTRQVGENLDLAL